MLKDFANSNAKTGAQCKTSKETKKRPSKMWQENQENEVPSQVKRVMQKMINTVKSWRIIKSAKEIKIAHCNFPIKIMITEIKRGERFLF